MSNLPGSIHNLSATTTHTCDCHEDRAAVAMIQGETDSFGAEYDYVCQDCLDEYINSDKEDDVGYCDWCRTGEVVLKPVRDIDEGTHGPVYHCCQACISREARRVMEEWDF